MWPYFVLFLVPAVFTILRSGVGTNKSENRWNGEWRFVFVLMILMIGLRHEVGGDWFSYLRLLEDARLETLTESMSHSDPAYSLTNWISAQYGLGVYFVNCVFAIVFTYGLFVFCRAQPQPWLALVVAVPYLVIVVAMGYSRQGAAIGVMSMALAHLDQGRVMRFVLLLTFASLIHNSATVLLAFALFVGVKRRIYIVPLLTVWGFVVYTILLMDSIDSYLSGYIVAEYESSGAAIRVAMNALPALLFLILRKNFCLTQVQYKLWTLLALSALVFVLILLISPSSTAVDRIALYLIPVQLFVWSRLPGALERILGNRNLWTISIVAYSMAVLVVWLVFADNSSAWLPYQFYPLVLLWD